MKVKNLIGVRWTDAKGYRSESTSDFNPDKYLKEDSITYGVPKAMTDYGVFLEQERNNGDSNDYVCIPISLINKEDLKEIKDILKEVK